MVSGGGGNGEVVFDGDRVSLGADEKVLEMLVVTAVQQCERASCH